MLFRSAAAPLLRLPATGAGLRALLQWGAYPSLQVDDAVLAQFLTPLHEPGGSEAALAAAGALTADARRLYGNLAAVRQPTLAIWGGRDRVLPPHHADRLRQALPHARFAVEPASGHCPMEDSPLWFARQLAGVFAAT